MIMKMCYNCQEIKEFQEFWKNKSRKDGYTHECKDCSNERRNKRYSEDKEFRLRRKNYRLTSKYGEETLKLQIPNKCPICKKSEKEILDKIGRGFVIDHCHITGVVRGYICSHCNKGLGHFKDNIQSLQNAILYLENNTTKEVQ